ncbi:DENN domain and WD repeat-containing protein SCD1 (Protein STOMATAL CYTOKINESIS DEFECTIVE 1) [Durusdinium trenchii]|uniref:DENN domain and WD repeat-containing protein SCD1 (Protein STOMATAL CYTOKINESIS DEFECTIVE 1) n=1 Tax=Durusdinium trenchii TaxID=1381693 RepID=A0ABP0L5U9_9DINO
MAANTRLIRYLAVLGLEPLEPEALEAALKSEEGLKAVTLERFPQEDDDVPLSPVLSPLPDFCFKDGLRLEEHKPSPSPSFTSVVFTSSSGGRLHVACLMVHERMERSGGGYVYAPKALCLVSLFPCLELLRSLLSDLVLAARADQEMQRFTGEPCDPSERLVFRLVSQIFYELPLPPNRHTMVTLTAGLKEVTILDQEGFTRDFSFRPLVAFLSVNRLAQLFVLVLTERKVVLSSQQLSPALLAVILEALRALLFPLEWEHVYLPILPPSFRWALESPAPFLMGMAGKAPLASELAEDVVVFDLDTGKSIPDKIQAPAGHLQLQRLMERLTSNRKRLSMRCCLLSTLPSPHGTPRVDYGSL